MQRNVQLEEIKNLLYNFEKEAHLNELKGDANWTYEIKKRLAELGRRYEYKTCTSGFKDECDSEWLYDLVWYKEEGEGDSKTLIDVPLVLESEWNILFPPIKYDFEKLLVANARLKVMICQSNNINKEHRLNYFRDAVAKYQINKNDDVYLIALLDYHTEEFYFETIEK